MKAGHTRTYDFKVSEIFNFWNLRGILGQQVRVKKFVPNKKGDIGMEVYYLCQPNTYVIACEFGKQQ